MISKMIGSLGYELEGRWDRSDLPSGFYDYFKGDCSVEFEDCRGDGDCYDDEESDWHIGEVASPPFEDMGDAENWLDKFYPYDVNRTCGFHIHMRLKDNALYPLLLNTGAHDLFLGRVRTWAETLGAQNRTMIIDRLTPDSQFCATQYECPSHINGHGDRYRAFNALPLTERHSKTFEYRAWPMFYGANMAFTAMVFTVQNIDKIIEEQLGCKTYLPLAAGHVSRKELTIAKRFPTGAHKTCARHGAPNYAHQDLLSRIVTGIGAHSPLPAGLDLRTNFCGVLCPTCATTYETGFCEGHKGHDGPHFHMVYNKPGLYWTWALSREEREQRDLETSICV